MTGFTIDTGVVDGKTIAEWTTDWWKWALQLPIATNPFTDTTGQFAGENNNGPVFFIAGVSQQHSFDVPFGKPLLVPLRNQVDTPPEGLPNSHASDSAIRATESTNSEAFNRSVTNLEAEIDGQPIANLFAHLVNTAFFNAGTATAGTLATDFYGVAPPGTVLDPSKASGYWLMIDNLPMGEHTLHFAASWNSYTLKFDNVTVPAGTLDVTDHINVV